MPKAAGPAMGPGQGAISGKTKLDIGVDFEGYGQR